MPLPPPYQGIRSLIETPIMDDHKWAKIPDIPADSFLVDLEDSVPPPLKEAARTRVQDYLRRPEYFGDRLVIARPNHISTPWGRDDVIALAEAGAACVAFPKCANAEEVIEVQELFRAHGADPDIFAAIETAPAVLDVADIAALDKVVAIGLGAGDLSADMGVSLYGPDGQLNPMLDTARVLVSIAGSASDCLTCDFVYAPDVRDLVEIRRRLETSRLLGYTTVGTFYPPHVALINEVFSPSAAEVESANEVIGIYEEAVESGLNAVALESGRTILVHDYQKALGIRARAEVLDC